MQVPNHGDTVCPGPKTQDVHLVPIGMNQVRLALVQRAAKPADIPAQPYSRSSRCSDVAIRSYHDVFHVVRRESPNRENACGK
jgi:hypothetical protein